MDFMHDRLADGTTIRFLTRCGSLLARVCRTQRQSIISIAGRRSGPNTCVQAARGAEYDSIRQSSGVHRSAGAHEIIVTTLFVINACLQFERCDPYVDDVV